MRTYKLITLVAVIAGLGACSGISNASFADAQTAFEANEFSKSRVILHSVLDQDESNQEVRLLLIDSLLNMSEGYVAERYINQLPATAIDPAERLRLEAHALIAQGKPERAIELLETVEDRDAWIVEAYVTELWAHLEAGTLEDNSDLLVAAVNRFPDSAEIHARAAQYFKSLDDWERVADAVGYSLEADADQYEARLLSGELAIREGTLEPALEIYQRLAKDFPDYAVPVVNVVGLHIDLEQIEQAEQSLRTALARHPGYPMLEFQKARILFEQGAYRESASHLQKLSGQLQRFTPALILSAELDLKLGNREMARAQLAKASRDERLVPEVERIMKEAGLTEL